MNDRNKRSVASLVIARDAINEAIRQINLVPTALWVWRELSENEKGELDWYNGVEDESAKICNIEIDGFIGDIVMESNLVEIHIYDSGNNDWRSWYRDFGKQDGNDPFTNDSELGYIFGRWVVQELTQTPGIGIDDIRDIFKMTPH